MAVELPIGVGQVPQWWMDITPHYTLDEEDAEARRAAEDQMAFYYMQLAAADDAGLLDSDGNPRSDANFSSWSPHTPWAGRSNTGGGGGSAASSNFGGRNFQAGQAVVDPKLFGITESDPEYRAYLTGAKLPPGYFETMGEFARCDEGGTQGILNNLKQTDFGRYGRQAETPSFKPAWAKKKLRSTQNGTNIRQGHYDDSPNKHVNHRRIATTSADISSPPVHYEGRHPDIEVQGDILVDNMGGADHSRPDEEHDTMAASDPSSAPTSAPPASHSMTRTVRTIVRDGDEPPQRGPAKLEHSEYMKQPAPVLSEQERKLQEQREKLARLKELQRQQQLLKQQQEQQAQQQVVGEEEEESYEEEIIEEEIVEYSEGSYEEEVIEEEQEISDMLAQIAAKQAELERLNAQG